VAKARLAVEILAAYVRVRRQLASRSLPAAVETLRPRDRATIPLSGDDQAERIAGARLGHAVGRTLAPLPGDNRCLVRSLVLTTLLARRGISSSLIVGVRSGPEFLAHAWVERKGVALLDPGGPEFGRLLEL